MLLLQVLSFKKKNNKKNGLGILLGIVLKLILLQLYLVNISSPKSLSDQGLHCLAAGEIVLYTKEDWSGCVNARFGLERQQI